MPPWLLTLCQKAPQRESLAADAPIPQGQRNDALFHLGCSLRARGCSGAVLLAALLEMNRTQCQPPLQEEEVHTIAASCATYQAGTLGTIGSQTTETAGSQREPARLRTISAKDLYAKESPRSAGLSLTFCPSVKRCLSAVARTENPCVWNLCLAVATGGTALSTYPVEQGNVLYLALEDGERRAQKRLKDQMQHAAMGTPPERLELVLWDAPRIGDGLEEQLSVWLDEHPGARLVVIDILEKVRPGARMAAPSTAMTTPHWRRFAPRAGPDIAILIVHHSNKTKPKDFRDSASGAMSLVGACDTFWCLRRVAGEPNAALHIIGRDVELGVPGAIARFFTVSRHSHLAPRE